MYYSFPNIDNSNNCFTYMPGVNVLSYNIITPEDSYHVEDINEFIQREMRKNGHYDKANDKDNIKISANTNTLTLWTPEDGIPTFRKCPNAAKLRYTVQMASYKPRRPTVYHRYGS